MIQPKVKPPSRKLVEKKLRSYLSHHVAEDQARDAPFSTALWILQHLPILLDRRRSVAR